jgi:hypothetical protein
MRVDISWERYPAPFSSIFMLPFNVDDDADENNDDDNDAMISISDCDGDDNDSFGSCNLFREQAASFCALSTHHRHLSWHNRRGLPLVLNYSTANTTSADSKLRTVPVLVGPPGRTEDPRQERDSAGPNAWHPGHH